MLVMVAFTAVAGGATTLTKSLGAGTAADGAVHVGGAAGDPTRGPVHASGTVGGTACGTTAGTTDGGDVRVGGIADG